MINYLDIFLRIWFIFQRDSLPKLCQKELIDSTEQFIAVKLRGRLESKDLTLEDLVDVDPMEEERKELLALKSQYEEALKTMNELLIPFNWFMSESIHWN